MQFPSKTVYRIDSQGKYLGEVFLDPQLVPKEGGLFSIEYPTPTDIGITVEEQPPSDDHLWDGTQWVEPESARPEAPPIKLYHKIDLETGFIVEPVVIAPVWLEDLREWRYIVPNDHIEEGAPQDSGFFKPKWDIAKRKWVEGGQPPVIAPVIDWDAFINAFTASTIDDVLEGTTSTSALMRLNRLLSRAPNIDFDLLISAWNDCLDGVASVGDEFVSEVRSLVAAHHLPVSVDDGGKLSRE